jgi:hypothetical protein
MNNIDKILQLADIFDNKCSFIKEGRIRKLPNGKYRVISEKGKNLGTSNSKDEAKKRLKQVEYFKHRDHNNIEDKDKLDFTKADDFSYSAIMRCIKHNGTKEQMMSFLKIFKGFFDKAVKEKLQKPEKIALQKTVVKFGKIYPIKISKKMIKNAAISELGNAILVGKYLADIVRFTLNRIPSEKRKTALAKLRQKIYHLNEQQIAMKTMPPYSSLGQSITFIKHVLFNHDAQYIREVLNNITRNLT